MSELIKFIDNVKYRSAMHVEISYSKITDWMIRIYKQACSPDGTDIEIFSDQHCDIEYLAAKAQVKIKDWLMENEGGY